MQEAAETPNRSKQRPTKNIKKLIKYDNKSDDSSQKSDEQPNVQD